MDVYKKTTKNHSLLGIAELDPGGGVVAGLLPPSDDTVHPGGVEPAGGHGVQQQVVDPQPPSPAT